MVVFMAIVVCILLLYIIVLRKQIKNINALVEKRIKYGTNQVISLELIDTQLNTLAENINISFKAEEDLRLKVVHDEEEFKKLIANISHDLRTPLTALKGYLQMLDKSELTINQREKLAVARKHAQALGDMIEHFFEYAYLMESKPEIHMERLNLTNVIMECIAAAIPVLDEKNLKTYIDEQQVFIQGNKEMMRRIINNLIRNCTVHAKGYIEISLSEEEEVVMHVKNPIGEAENIDVSRLFERFYVGSGSRQTTGLGLAIVKLLTQQMNGEVNAIAEEGVLDIQLHFPRVV